MTAFEKWDEPRPVALTVDDFLRLADSGAFDSYAKTELIEGVIVAMNAQYGSHAHAKTQLLRRLADAVEAVMPGYQTWSEVSVAIPPSSTPEPDIVVTNWTPARKAVPIETIVLIVEVADTTQRYDLGTKANLYAAAGVGEYWVLDLEEGTIHQLWGGGPQGYTQRRNVRLGERVEATTLPGVVVETAGL